MRTDIRIVSPYRPFEPESPSHQTLGPFDWIAALRMLAASVRASCGCETVAITDVATALPVPAFRYPTQQSRLMLWILEVSLAYLQSDDFDRDTVFVSPDTLVLRDLRPYFGGDLTVLVRTPKKYHNRPVINAVQWWPVAAKDRLIGFYRTALARAQALPEHTIVWGADSESIRQLLEPIALGIHDRDGLQVSMREASTILISISTAIMRALDAGRPIPRLSVPIADFKGPLRKTYLAAYFEALSPSLVAS